jgi:glutamate mutase epsilon subunit
MIRYPGHTSLEDVTLFFFEGETIPFTHEGPLANCSSREEFQDTVRLMGALSRDDPLLFRERFAPLPGLHLPSFVQCVISCIRL